MQSLTLKKVIFSSTLVITLIIGVQLYLLDRMYSSKEKEFYTNVSKSIHSLFSNKYLTRNTSDLSRAIIRPDEDTYLVLYDSIGDYDSVIRRICAEFVDFNVLADFNIGFYNQQFGKYYKLTYIRSAPSFSSVTQQQTNPAQPFLQENHIYINFPNRKNFLLGEIKLWIISGTFLILSLTALAVILFYLYHQRFWNEIQKDFVNNFIHEFSTPIAVLNIASKVLQNDGIEMQPRRLKKYATIVKEQTDQLQHKVSRILELALPEKRETNLEKEVVDVNALITKAIGFVQPLMDEKRASIEFIRSEGPVEVNAHSTHLLQAIVNLLDNSLKYSERPDIKIQTLQIEKTCSISVKDNGIGMEEKYFKHIFRKFYRIPTGNVHNVKGFGIGLNFVKKVIDAHDGRIEVNSMTGIGTEFRIQLPLN
jgi:two-component system phosphate regulon sensor histidine kinase PhoR